MAAVVEGAIFYALYGTDKTGPLEKRTAIVFGFVMLAIVLCISLKDQADADGFMARIREYESESPFNSPVSIRWGRHLMAAAIVLFLSVNAVLGLSLWH